MKQIKLPILKFRAELESIVESDLSEEDKILIKSINFQNLLKKEKIQQISGLPAILRSLFTSTEFERETFFVSFPALIQPEVFLIVMFLFFTYNPSFSIKTFEIIQAFSKSRPTCFPFEFVFDLICKIPTDEEALSIKRLMKFRSSFQHILINFLLQESQNQ